MQRLAFHLRAVMATAIAATFVAGTVLWLMHSGRAAREAEVQRHVGLGLAFADSLERELVARAPADISQGEAVAALYLERLRLGLGSPFRLIEQALRDPAVSVVGQRSLAEAMLARTIRGETYRVQHSALDLLENDPWGTGRGRGSIHHHVIDSAVASTDDPRVGELRVRLAYRLATVSGVLSPRAPEIATSAAAQARDRILAMRDGRALLAESDDGTIGRFALLRMWRETRRLAVERPIIVPLSARQEREAIAGLPQLVARIEGIGVTDLGEPASEATLEPASDGLAARMAAVAAARSMPPLAPVGVAVGGYASLIAGRKAGAASVARQRFLDRAVNEESLGAEYALLRARAPEEVRAAGLAVLTAGVALRPYAQERAWLEGDVAPTVRDLQTRYGVAVSFDPSTRPAWRPYLQRTLEVAIVDLRRVLPGFDPRGLRVHFGPTPLGVRALAMHDPTRRTIYFPPGTSSGVIAHEFAHDLDWQAARREYGGSGWYRTDHALRRPSDALAGALRQMASAVIDETASAKVSGRSRPTEVFARNVDWFVSAALAREGRVNGHLSAVQDPVLTGYASAITPEAAREGGSATLRALDGITLLSPLSRSWFSDLFGVDRRLSVHEAVRQVLETPVPSVEISGMRATDRMQPAALSTVFSGAPEVSGAWRCVLDGFTDRAADAASVRAVVQYAADARARGVIKRWEALALRRPERAPVALRALTGAPWDPAIAERTLRDVRDAILWSALVGSQPDLSGRRSSGGTSLRAAWSCV
jgi:hypothetical protein